MQVGIDIQDVEPVKKFIGTNKMARIFSAAEMKYIEKKNHAPDTIAGIFCAKEAFFKALGKGISLGTLLDVEVSHGILGAPFYIISEKIKNENDLTSAEIALNISHTKSTAVAVCIINKK